MSSFFNITWQLFGWNLKKAYTKCDNVSAFKSYLIKQLNIIGLPTWLNKI